MQSKKCFYCECDRGHYALPNIPCKVCKDLSNFKLKEKMHPKMRYEWNWYRNACLLYENLVERPIEEHEENFILSMVHNDIRYLIVARGRFLREWEKLCIMVVVYSDVKVSK